MQCPWCSRWCLKDDNCMFIFACGLDAKNVFHSELGCGNSFCFQCGLKYCGPYYDLKNSKKHMNARDQHDESCCQKSSLFCPQQYCKGGHSSHCPPRTFSFLTPNHNKCTSSVCLFSVNINDVGLDRLDIKENNK